MKMTNTSKKRGRKSKQVDTDMFHQLISYYQEKPLNSVTQHEITLAEFMQQFVFYSVNFDELAAQHKKIKEGNPRLTNKEAYEALTNINSDYAYVRLGNKAPTLEFFKDWRSDEQERVHLKNYHFSCYNVDDIYQANRYFQELKKEDARKLMQRLRKMKFQQSKSSYEKKVGIEIDSNAYEKIKSYQEMYGFKTLSTGIMVMAIMACKDFDYGLSEALESLYQNGRLQRGDVFTSNVETKRIENLINNDLIYYSKENYRYYISTAIDEMLEAGVYEVGEKDVKIIRQMKNSNRVFFGTSKSKLIIGNPSNKEVIKNNTPQKKDVVVVQNVQGLMGGEDIFKAFQAVEKLLEKWDLAKYQKVELLGFDPYKMDINDQNEVQQRLSLLLNIHEKLRQLFDNSANTYGYMTKRNHNKPFNGRQPVNVACEGLAGLKLVYNALLSLSGAV